MLEIASRPSAVKPVVKPDKPALVTPSMAGTLLLIGDLTSLALGLVIVAVAEQRMPALVTIYSFALALMLTLHLQRSARQYEVGQARHPRSAPLRLFGSWGLAASIAMAPGFLLTDLDAEAVTGISVIVAIAAIAGAISRALSSYWIGRLIGRGYWRSRVAIIGGGEHGQRLIHHLRRGDRPLEIVGLFDDRFDRLPMQIAAVPVLGGIDELLTYARSHAVDEVVVALPKGADRRLADWFQKLAVLPLKVSHCQDIPAFSDQRVQTQLFGLPAARLSSRPLDGWGYVIKLLEDRTLAAIALVLALPLMATIALAVKVTSPGPVLFRQRRYGFNNNEIEILKFRSMHVHDGPLEQAKRDDPRTTMIGRILRRTSMDELPQLFNVLKGDMSLVGPRPHAVAHNELYARSINQYLCRHRVKPGITGWAQVNGWRGETDTIEKMEARVAHDLHYIDHWSLFLDFKIMIMTVSVGFRHPNAY